MALGSRMVPPALLIRELNQTRPLVRDDAVETVRAMKAGDAGLLAQSAASACAGPC
ncbi:hypothetical protein SALBM217S_01941 [Streptomyces griseoloalbus]